MRNLRPLRSVARSRVGAGNVRSTVRRMSETPSVGRIVHYVSYGTPGGEFPSVCRAAVITEVHNSEELGLAVLNPTGMFFNRSNRDDGGSDGHVGGTWHWPERV